MERGKRLMEIFTYRNEEEVCKQIEVIIRKEEFLSVGEVNPLIKICCERKYFQLTKKLLSLVVDKHNTKFKNLKENTCALRAFYYSAKFGFSQLLSFFLSNKFKVRMKFQNKLTAFDYAIFNSQFETLKLLCENSPKDSPALISAFFLAISLNQTQYILYFLDELKISINIQNKNQFNAFHYAVMTNQIDVAKLLIKRGINVYQITKNNENSLQLSIQHKNILFTDFLMKEFQFDLHASALIDLMKHFYFTRSKFLPKKYFKLKKNIMNEDEELAYLITLIDKKIDINFTDINRKCAIIYAILEKKIKCANYLFDIMTKDQIFDSNVIREVIKRVDIDVVKRLFPARWIHLIDNRSTRSIHYSSLQIAILYKRMDFIVYLVEELKVDINYINNQRSSALCTAISENEFNIAKYLIEKGASLVIDYTSALYFTAKYTDSYDQFMKYLIEEKGMKLKGFNYYSDFESISTQLLSQKKFQFFRDFIYIHCKIKKEINLDDHYEILNCCGRKGDLEMLKFLIEEMKMKIFPTQSSSVLFDVVERGDYEMIEYLIMKERRDVKFRKRVDKTNYLMITVINHCEKNFDLCDKVVDLLLEDKPNLNYNYLSGRCVLSFIQTNISLLQKLISKGAKPHGDFGCSYYPLNSKRTPLCYHLLFQNKFQFRTRKEIEVGYDMLEHIYRYSILESTSILESRDKEASAKWWSIRHLHDIGFNLRGNPSKKYAPFSRGIDDMINNNFQLKHYINLLLLEDKNYCYHFTSFDWKITFFTALFADPPFTVVEND